MLMVARLVIAVVVGTAVGLFAGISGWLLLWFVWGSILGLIIVRWWAVSLAALAFPVTFVINQVLGTKGELHDYGWAQSALWALVTTSVAAAGIVVGVAAMVAGSYVTRRIVRARGWI